MLGHKSKKIYDLSYWIFHISKDEKVSRIKSKQKSLRKQEFLSLWYIPNRKPRKTLLASSMLSLRIPNNKLDF